MPHNFCNECGTENEEKYRYCKHCGAPLEDEPSPAKNEPGVTPPVVPPVYPTSPYPTPGSPVTPISPNGTVSPNETAFSSDSASISGSDVAAFLGARANRIMPKFIGLERRHSKVSWCWPAAVLSYIMGPFGAAIWFFYRKMYKIALLFVAAGAAMIGSAALLSLVIPHPDFSALFSWASSDFAEMEPLFNAYQVMLESLCWLPNILLSLFSTGSCVVAGLFGYHWYKNHAANRIARFRQTCTNVQYYPVGLMAIGGTSTGMAVLGAAIMIVARIIESALL